MMSKEDLEAKIEEMREWFGIRKKQLDLYKGKPTTSYQDGVTREFAVINSKFNEIFGEQNVS
jgi:hypothetical protein